MSTRSSPTAIVCVTVDADGLEAGEHDAILIVKKAGKLPAFSTFRGPWRPDDKLTLRTGFGVMSAVAPDDLGRGST